MIENKVLKEQNIDKDSKNKQKTKMEQLEQALIDIQSDKCRIQKLQEDLVSQVELQKAENQLLRAHLNQAEQQMRDSKDQVRSLEKELSDKEDENIVVHICVQKLQEELAQLSRQVALKDVVIEEKEAYIRTISRRLDIRDNFPRCRDDLLKSLATDNVSTV